MAHKFKGGVRVEGSVELPNIDSSRALEINGSGEIQSSTVTSTELGHLSGVTSAVQTQLDGKSATGHTHVAADITDFDTEVSNNTDVAANTAARHDAVTVVDSSEIDFTLVGQQITASIVASSIDESKLDASVNASLDLADSASQPGHTHTASEITDFDAAVTGNSEVLANSAARHDAVTLNADDATQQTLNLFGQEIQVNLATSSTDGAMSAEDKTKLDGIEANATADQSAAEVPFAATGDLEATNVQDALAELDSEKLALAGGTMSGAIAMATNKITGLGDPTAAQDAATKAYVDAVAEGLKPKEAVRVATTAAGTLASSFEDGDTVDGVVLATGDRILIKDQVDASENGIYVVAASGAPTRATDFDSLTPIDEVNGAYTAVQEGTENAGKLYVQTGTVSTIDTDDIDFVFFNSTTGLVGGDGIDISGNTVSVDHDGEGLTFVSNQLALELDGSTLSKSASGIKVADASLTDAQINASADIVFSKMEALTGDRAVITDGSGVVTQSTVTATELGYVSGVTSSIQTQLDAKADESIEIQTAADSGLAGGGDLTANRSLSVDITNTTELAQAADDADEILIWDDSAGALRKITKANLVGSVDASAGDIEETSFSIANNQSSAANVTGFAFANAEVRSFKAHVSIEVDATADLYEVYEIMGIQKGASWEMSQVSTGDDSLVLFTITSAGQVQYTSADYAGFSSGAIKFRAITTSV